MIYLDSNIFIYAIVADDKRASACRSLLKAVHDQSLEGCTSVLTWDEVVYSLQRLVGPDAGFDRGEDLLHFPNLALLACNERVLRDTCSLGRAHKLKPRDAIHVATARLAQASMFVSEDGDFRAVPNLSWRRPEEAI